MIDFNSAPTDKELRERRDKLEPQRAEWRRKHQCVWCQGTIVIGVELSVLDADSAEQLYLAPEDLLCFACWYAIDEETTWGRC
jgi:hypothetical protein